MKVGPKKSVITLLCVLPTLLAFITFISYSSSKPIFVVFLISLIYILFYLKKFFRDVGMRIVDNKLIIHYPKVFYATGVKSFSLRLEYFQIETSKIASTKINKHDMVVINTNGQENLIRIDAFKRSEVEKLLESFPEAK